MAIVKKYKARVLTIMNPINGVYTIEFESLSEAFKYAPGQFLHLAIDSDYDGSGQWPDSRCFSMQSNPNDDYIKITYSVKGKFTKQMEEKLMVGVEVWLKLPYGDLFSNAHSKLNTVFIAGGTGITPFLSLFTHNSFNEYINPKIYIGFKSEEYNIYIEEIDSSCNLSKKIKYFYEDIDGIIDIDFIFKENSENSIYYISGPPLMIKTFKNKLLKYGVPEKSVITDVWS